MNKRSMTKANHHESTSKKKYIVAATISGAVVAFAIAFWKQIAALVLIIILLIASMFSRPNVCEDIARYEELRSGPNAAEDYRYQPLHCFPVFLLPALHRYIYRTSAGYNNGGPAAGSPGLMDVHLWQLE